MQCCWAECAHTPAFRRGRRTRLLKQNSCAAPRACICQGASLPRKFQAKSYLLGRFLYSIWDWINLSLALTPLSECPCARSTAEAMGMGCYEESPTAILTEYVKTEVPPRHLSVHASPSRYASPNSFPTSQTGDVVVASCGKDTLKWSQQQKGESLFLACGPEKQSSCFSSTSLKSSHRRLVLAWPLPHISLTLSSWRQWRTIPRTGRWKLSWKPIPRATI